MKTKIDHPCPRNAIEKTAIILAAMMLFSVLPAASAASITSNGTGGGNWSSTATWAGGVVPTSADDVTIADGDTVTIDTAANANTLVVGQGSSGVLQFESATARTLTVGGNVTIAAGGVFQSNPAGTVTTHSLSVGGNLTNNGTLNFSTNADTAGAGITFTGAGASTWTGNGNTNLRQSTGVTLNKGTNNASTLDFSPGAGTFTVQGANAAGFLSITNGTFKISGSNPFSNPVFNAVSYSIPATGGIWLNNTNATIAGLNGSPTNSGLLRLSNGIFNIGTVSGNAMGTGTGCSFIIEGGTMNVAGRLTGASTFVTYTQSAGTVNVATAGNPSTSPSFGFTGTTGVLMNMSGGTINLVNANTLTTADYNQTGTMNFTGGTLNVGTAATAVNFNFRVQGQMPNVVIDNTSNNKNALLSGQGNVWGNLTINTGTMVNLNPGTAQTLLMIGPTITNNGAIVVNTNNTGTVNFAGQLQTVGTPYAQNYTGTGTFGTAALRVATFSLQNPLGVTLNSGVSALNIYRINVFFGQITNSNLLAIGAGDAVALVIQRGATGIAFAAGNLDVAPTFNIGTGGLTLVYAQGTSSITTGPEIPASRTVLGVQIINPAGVTLAGGPLTATNTSAALLLSSGKLTTDATNLLTLSATTTGAVSGGSGATYVNGPLARTLPASLVSGSTYTFPVGKSNFKMLELVNPTTNAGGTVTIQAEVFDSDSGGTAGTGFDDINHNRYWNAQITAGAANFTNATVRLTEAGTVSANAIGQSTTQTGAYGSIGGTVAPPTIGPSSAVTSLGFFAVGRLTGAPTIMGNFNTGTGGDFTTLTAAVAALNGRVITGPVTITLTDNSYAGETFPITIQPNGGASATNTITIKPGAGAQPVISGSSTSALIVLNGADYVTIDGSNTVGGTTRDMTLTNTNTSTASAVIWGQTVGTNDPATNNTIKNLNLTGNASTATLAGVGFGSSTISSSSLGTRNDNNHVQNDNVTSVQFGVYSQGASSTNKNVGTVITGNQLGGAGAAALGRAGIFVGFDDGVQITNNTVNNVTASNSADVFGIALGSISISTTAFTTIDDVVNATVTGNFVGTVLKTDTFSAAGISVATPGYGTTLIANNSISGVNANGTAGDFAAGIYVGGSTAAPIQVYYNSVSMTGARDAASNASSPSFALAVLNSNPLVDIRDNALFNSQTSAGAGSNSYAIGLSSVQPFTNVTSNYNDFFTSGAQSFFSRIGSLATSAGFDLTSLPAWQGATGKDANSIAANPMFTSTTDLRPVFGSPLLAAGTPIAGVTTDITGASRSNTTPSIGAYENAILPNISYTPLGNTASTANRTLPGTVSSPFGVPTSGIGLPVIYYRKGTSGSFASTQAAWAGGSNYNFTVDYSLVSGGSVSPGDTIQYFVVAQDNAGTPNVTSNPLAGASGFTANPPAVSTPPNPPNSYLILYTISGSKNVGVGGDYATLTDAVNALNNSVITGPVTFVLTDPSYTGQPTVNEAFPLVINANSGSSATNTVTFKPASGVTVSITGSSASALFTLNGADYMTIDGSNAGTSSRDMTITNTNTGTSSAVIWLQTAAGPDGATNNTIKNVNLVGNSNTTTLFGVGAGGSTISTASLGTGNNNNTFQNCNISKTQYGIYSQGPSAANKNTGNVITQNLINAASPNNVQIGGIMVGFENNIQITGNSISGMNRSTSTFGIGVGFVTASFNGTTFTGNEVTNATISKNFIGSVQSTGTFSAMGIAVASFASGMTQMDNNMVAGVTANSTPGDFSAGIFVGGTTGTGALKIFYNSVSMTGARGAATTASYGLAVGGTSVTVADVRDNAFYNTQTATGSPPGTSYAIGLAYTGYTTLTSNYNDLFASGTQGVLGVVGSLVQGSGTNQANLAAWQGTTGQDPNSISADPVFVSTIDLHLSSSTSSAANMGTPIAAVTIDFDGEIRSVMHPDIGADEIVSADLSNLVLSAGALTPPFDPAITSYTASVSHATTSITVTPTVFDSNATIRVNGVIVPSGTASDPINLSVGDNTVTTMVTTEFGMPIKTYTVIVNRAALPPVNNTNDSGPGSLREALMNALDGDTITFNFGGGDIQQGNRQDSAETPLSTITLTSGELVIDKNVTIMGPGADVLEVTRDQNASAFRIFHVMPGHTVTIEGVAISNGNAFNSFGGGILNDQSVLTVNSCALNGNSALGSPGAGGGIFSNGSGSGGAASLTIANSTFSGNSAVSGGAIENDGASGTASLAINNSTLSGNSASFGGGILNENGGGGTTSLTIANSTLSGNAGEGILNYFGTLHIGNTILKAGSSGANIGNEGGTVTSHGYNLSSDDGGGFLTAMGDQINTDPMLGPLKDNGGPTLTHAPLINSQAIDQGKRDTIPALTTNIDQRGFPRPVDDPAVPNTAGGDASDIGAVELAVGVHPTSADSRKTHGGAGDFDIDLPFSGPVGIECRSGGTSNDYQMIVTFAEPVTFSSAAVTDGSGSVGSSSGSGTTQVTINLTGVGNAQRLTVALFDTDDGTNSGDVGVRMGVLIGDTTGDGVVNASDVGQTKSQVGQEVNGSNFRTDVAPNGIINASDVALVKSKSGTGLP